MKKKPGARAGAGAGAGAAWQKNQEPKPLEKKVRSRTKNCRLPSPGKTTLLRFFFGEINTLMDVEDFD